MNILFLSQRVPYPPNKGDKLRSFNQIRHLSRNHSISLVCLSDNLEDMEYAENLHPYCESIDIVFLPKLRSKWQSLLALLRVKPLTLSYFYSRSLQDVVNRKLAEERFDLIFVFCSSMAQYVEKVQHIPKVIDFVDVDSEKWNQYSTYASFPMNHVYQWESRLLRKYEAQLADTFQHCFFVSEKEADDFKHLVSPCPTVTPILNGVDSELFPPSEKPYNPKSLVFTGAMDYFANVEAVLYFVSQIMPHVQKAVPDLTLYVVGSNPTKEITLLQESHPNVVVTGYVDSVQPYVVNCAAMVAPMRIARGVQNKILEAMVMGVPVVTSSLGFEGISATPGTDIFVEDLPEQFAEQVIRLMQDDNLRMATSENSKKTAEQYYNWSNNLDELEKLLASM